jgi:hypothetical protein
MTENDFESICPEEHRAMLASIKQVGRASKHQQRMLVDALKDDNQVVSLLHWLTAKDSLNMPMANVIVGIKCKKTGVPREVALATTIDHSTFRERYEPAPMMVAR